MNRLQALVSNQLPQEIARRPFAAIIGDRPSKYAKSPSIWNPTFRALGFDATYVALDVTPERLPPLIAELRRTEQYLGGNVTVPYKVAIIDHLDNLEEKARLIGAVNTVVRTPEGRLVGYNTDGQGGLDTLTRAAPEQSAPFFEMLTGRRVLLLGAGGAGRALAFYLAEAIGPGGRLTVANRSADRARELADAVFRAYGNAEAMGTGELEDLARQADLIINATTCGQSGLRTIVPGQVTCLEPYSPLAPAKPAPLEFHPGMDESGFYAVWARASCDDILRNQAESLALLCEVPPSTAFFDIVYSPPETTLLRQARFTGHRTLNGKGMNIAQAADAFFNRVLRGEFIRRGLYNATTYQRVLEVMHSVW